MNNKWYAGSWKAQFFSGLMIPVMFFVGNLGYVGVAILGGYLAVQGVINVGDIQAFIQYVRSFTQPISQIANIGNILQQTAATSERVFKFLEEKEEPLSSPNPLSSNLWKDKWSSEMCILVITQTRLSSTISLQSPSRVRKSRLWVLLVLARPQSSNC